MPPKKSVFRQAGAQHFQLVHRSQRDPLINDPEASQRVFKPVGRANERDRKSGNTLADLEADPSAALGRENEGEAALYGITYDDSSYDYMQHLRQVGLGPAGGDSFLLAAPRGSGVAPGMKGGQGGGKGKGKATAEDLFALPSSVMASEKEISLQDAYAREQSIPTELQGLQPDMDPHLRQVLEALDDEAFEDDEDAGGEGWFDSLVGGGEVREGEAAPEFEFAEWGVGEDGAAAQPMPEDLPEDAGWEERFKAFKRAQAARGDEGESAWGGDEDGDANADGEGTEGADGRSEMADTIGSLPSQFGEMVVQGGKKRRGKRGPSDASGMSMSSSSVYRTQGLRDLDDRFDKVELDYELDDEDDDDFDDNLSLASGMSGTSALSSASHLSSASLFSSSSAAPPLVSREDFDAILDDFLENYEVVGSKYRPSLGGTGLSGPEKLRVLRDAVDGDENDGIGREENRRRILEIERMGRGVGVRMGKAEERVRVRREEDEGEKWDVETILTTYTNTENHPSVIRTRRPGEQRARAARAQAQAQAEAEAQAKGDAPAEAEDEHAGSGSGSGSESDSGSETETEARVTVARQRGESAEDKKTRKAAVKAERAARRTEKKTRQQTFGDERRKQIAAHKKSVGGGRAADLSVGARGVVSLS